MMMAWSGCWRKASAVAAASWSAPAQAAVKRGQQRQVLHAHGLLHQGWPAQLTAAAIRRYLLPVGVPASQLAVVAAAA